jgi:hypothetical protein
MSEMPIFIHAFWRTGSTYLWKKFRDRPQYRAYYEPLHEILIKPEGAILAELSGGDRAALRHPPIDEFYFAEFPFRENGGVECFEKRFSYENYCLDEDKEDEPLRRYIANLIAHASRHGQRAVLQFNRSLFRLGWLRRHFPSVNILLLRRPADVWRSVLSFADCSFAGVFYILLGQNRAKPPLCFLPEWTSIPCFAGETIDRDYAFYRPAVMQNVGKLYPAFFDFYVTATIQAASLADCILDIDEISANPQVCKLAEKRLAELGAAIAMDDCRVPSERGVSSQTSEWLAYEDFARVLLPHLLPRSISINYEQLLSHKAMLGEYFWNLLLDFTDRASPGARRLSEIARTAAPTNYMEGVRLLSAHQSEEACHRFSDALRGKRTRELWRHWAAAQSMCKRPLLAELGHRQAALQGAATESLPR